MLTVPFEKVDLVSKRCFGQFSKVLALVPCTSDVSIFKIQQSMNILL